MRIFAFLLLVFSSGFVGTLLGYSLTRRRRELETIIHGLELLETEMLFAQNPLWLSFAHVGAKIQGNVGEMFNKIGAALAGGEYQDSGAAFKAVIGDESEKLCLTMEDKEILLALSSDLGTMDGQRQNRRLASAAGSLRTALLEAGETEKKWRRICNMGGWMLGMIFGLLLI